MCCFFGGCRNNFRCCCRCCRCRNFRDRDCEDVRDRDECEEERRRAFCEGFRAGCNDPRCHCCRRDRDRDCDRDFEDFCE